MMQNGKTARINTLNYEPWILIDGNEQLDAFCSGNNTNGLTSTSPHVIQNLAINLYGTCSGTGVEIRNTNRFLIIRACTVSYAPWSAGIRLVNCTHVNITSCTVCNNYYGIDVINSTNIILQENYIVDNRIDSIVYSYSTITVSDGLGIRLDNSNASAIVNNTISDNGNCGILLIGSRHNLLAGNDILMNEIYGTSLHRSDDNTIMNDRYQWNYRTDVNVFESRNITMSNVTMSTRGLFLDDSDITRLGSHTITNDNLVNSRILYYYVNKVGLGSTNFTNAGQVILVNCNSTLVANQTIAGSSTG
nr:NosD domain-containing protein [Candidatus Sigynarchaeota archaeon]